MSKLPFIFVLLPVAFLAVFTFLPLSGPGARPQDLTETVKYWSVVGVGHLLLFYALSEIYRAPSDWEYMGFGRGAWNLLIILTYVPLAAASAM